MPTKNTTTTAKWTLQLPAPPEFFEQFPDFSPTIAQLLYNRGLTKEAAIAAFLRPAYAGALHAPELLQGMVEAVPVIQRCVERGEPIVIHGDYDADGITATALLQDVLERLGATVSTFIPDRYSDGYGVTARTLRNLQVKGAKLVITVDCGISSAAEIATARQSGLQIIVTDHHAPPANLPVAEAVINPHLPNDTYPNKALVGVGVAFKLAQALLHASALTAAQQEAAEKWLLDLVAIGTVADMAPLLDENRVLVRYGLQVLQRTRRPGLRALMSAANVAPETVSSSTIGYALAPRLNASGRLTHARHSLELLTTEDPARAATLASELNDINIRRQTATKEALQEARRLLPPMTDEQRIVVVSGHWPSGIVGLVAGRLCQELTRPALVIEQGAKTSTGSARSIPALNMVEMLRAHDGLLTKYGGHAGAAGFSLPTAKLPDFKASLEDYARAHLTADDLQPEILIESEILPAELNWPLLDALAEFQPFGIDNRQPQFLLRQAVIKEVRLMGQEQTHAKLVLELSDGRDLTALAFGMAALCADFTVGEPVDTVGQPVSSTFRDTKSLEWHVADIRSS